MSYCLSLLFTLVDVYASTDVAISHPGSWAVSYHAFVLLVWTLTLVDIDAITYFSGVTGVAYSCSVEILAAASIGSDLRYVPTTGHT